MADSNDVVPLHPNPVFLREKTPVYSWTVIIFVTLIVIAILAAVTIYAILRARRVRNVNRCEAGLCAFRYDTGEKRCPSSEIERLTFNPIFEGCSSGNYCQDERAPCAVLPGGVLNCDGVCGSGNQECACVEAP